jgi:hypothetical protein
LPEVDLWATEIGLISIVVKLAMTENFRSPIVFRPKKFNHHTIGDKMFLVVTIGLFFIFVLYDWNTNHKLNHTFENFYH